MRLLLALAPVLVFYVVEAQAGLRPAVVASLIVAAVDLAWTRWADGRWSRLSVATAVLVGGLGGLALVSDDPRFVLYGPAIGDLALSGGVVVSQLLGTNLVVAALEEQDPDLDLHPLERVFLDGMAWRFAGVLALHAALVVASASAAREVWLFVTGPLAWILVGLQVAGEVAYGRWVVGPQVDAAEDWPGEE